MLVVPWPLPPTSIRAVVSPVPSPPTFALACIYMKMSIEEAITALTLNGAAALNRADSIGSIEVGKKGDFVVLNTDNYHFLPYYVGMNCVNTTIKGECFILYFKKC